jgi:Secretion system C-terminal sorting domain
LILDAPPHAEKQNLDKLIRYTKRCAAKGIRIIPLVASGGGYDADKSLEYLMRSFALATNGTYGFLTDHSGIGGTHTAPTTDKYDVEKLNDMLVRIIDQFLFVPDCNVEQFVQQQEIQDTSMVVENYTMQSDTTAQDSTITNLPPDPISVFTLKCYPNPATDYVWVEISEVVSELFIADNSGKIIQRLQPTSKLTRLDLTDYPTGVYHLKAWINDKWASARIVVTKI